MHLLNGELTQLLTPVVTNRLEVEDDEDHFQTRILNIHGQDGTGIVPSNITNEGHEIQYFDLNVAQLRDLHWPNLVSAKMFLHLPAAPSPTDLKVWIDIRKVVLPQPSDVPFTPHRNELLCQLFRALKGQIISKRLLVSSFFFCLTVLKTNLFVRFLEESEDTKKSFRNYLTFRYQWISAKIEVWHPWQLKKSRSCDPFWSY